MRRLLFALCLASVGGSAVAVAQNGPPPGGGMGMGMMRMADANGDGVVTREEMLAEADARFSRMDTDRNGVVTPQERRAAMAAMMGRRGQMPPPPPGDGAAPPPPPPPPPPGERGGPNADASMTREQFLAAARARFDRMDANHDGKLDASEMAAPRGRGGRRGGGGDMPPPPPASPEQ